MRISAAVLIMMFFLAGCAHVVGKESLALADRNLSFRMLNEHTETYEGKYVLLGGIIAGVRNTASGGEIEIVQYELDSRGRPEVSESSGGRFLAQSDGFLDPLVYLTGLRVTLVGRVTGKKVVPLNSVDYAYPVVSIREIRLLKPDLYSPYPMFHFGVGIGHTF
jgi:outer membrane lipoprotein